MAIEQILNSSHPDFNPKDTKTKQYTRIKNFALVDSVSATFDGKLSGARQQIYTSFYYGRGIELFNRQNGSNEYRLRLNKPVSSDPLTFPTTFVVEFELLKNGSTYSGYPLSVDVGQHNWVGVRFTTRDTIVQNKVLIVIEYCTDKNLRWVQLASIEDSDSFLWYSIGDYGWALTADTSDPLQYPKDVSIDGWVIQRYSSTNNDIPVYYATYTHQQVLSSTVWDIKHSLGSYPSVRTFDTTDQEIYGDVVYVDANNIEITFSASYAGAAQLSSGDSIFIPGTGFVTPYDESSLSLPLTDGFEDVQWAELDTTLPTVSFTATPPPVVPYGSPVTFSYIGADNLGTIVGYEYRLNNANFVFTTQTTLNIPAEHLIFGTNNFSVRSIDDSDNASVLLTYTWLYPDVTPPNTILLTTPPLVTFMNSATFTFTGTDDLGVSHFEYQIDGGGWIALGPAITSVTLFGLTTTSHTFDVRAVDFSANVDPSPATYTWTVFNFSSVPDLQHWLDFTDSSTMNSGYSSYIHEQLSAATLWTINHNLANFPSISTVDLLGNRVYGTVTYVNNNTATLNFAFAQDGYAYINKSVYTHSQVVAAITWTVNHNLGDFPSITTVDTSGNEIFGTVSHISNNSAQITFAVAEDGFAYLAQADTSTTPFAATALVNIAHNREEYPSVTVVDAVGDEIFGTVVYVDENNISISFAGPQTGNVYLNSSVHDDLIEILEITEKSVNARTFTTAGIAETGPVFRDNLVPSLPIVVAGANFSETTDLLQDTLANAAVSGNELTIAAIIARDGNDSGSILHLTGATDDLSFGRASDGSFSEIFVNTGPGNTITAIPEAPYAYNENVSFVIVRIDPTGFSQSFINGKFIGQQEVYPGWTLGASSSPIRLGFSGTSAKVYHTVIYDRYLTDLEVSDLFSAYSQMYNSLSDLMVSEFTGAGAIGNADTGQTWTTSTGTFTRDGAGLLEVTTAPAFATIETPIISNYVVAINGLTLLNNDNDNYLVFRSLTGSLDTDYYRVKVENTFAAPGTNNIVLERVVASIPAPIDSITVPWVEDLGPDAVINIAIGVQGNTVSYGACLDVTPTFRADNATAWTGTSGTGVFRYATIPALVFGENNFGMSFGTTGIKMDSVRVLQKV
jgi:hypothetical protein